MDPNEVYKLLVIALDSGDAEEAEACFNSLDEWLRMGGFLPAPWDNATRKEA